MTELHLGDAVILAIGSVIANAAATWGIIKTQVAWLRRDVDELRAWRNAMGSAHVQPIRAKDSQK